MEEDLCPHALFHIGFVIICGACQQEDFQKGAAFLPSHLTEKKSMSSSLSSYKDKGSLLYLNITLVSFRINGLKYRFCVHKEED